MPLSASAALGYTLFIRRLQGFGLQRAAYYVTHYVVVT